MWWTELMLATHAHKPSRSATRRDISRDNGNNVVGNGKPVAPAASTTSASRASVRAHTFYYHVSMGYPRKSRPPHAAADTARRATRMLHGGRHRPHPPGQQCPPTRLPRSQRWPRSGAAPIGTCTKTHSHLPSTRFATANISSRCPTVCWSHQIDKACVRA